MMRTLTLTEKLMTDSDGEEVATQDLNNTPECVSEPSSDSDDEDYVLPSLPHPPLSPSSAETSETSDTEQPHTPSFDSEALTLILNLTLTLKDANFLLMRQFILTYAAVRSLLLFQSFPRKSGSMGLKKPKKTTGLCLLSVSNTLWNTTSWIFS